MRAAGWQRLGDILTAEPWREPGADPALREILEAGRHVTAAEGDGAAAILPGGEKLLLSVTASGIAVLRHATDEEVRLFLRRPRGAA